MAGRGVRQRRQRGAPYDRVARLRALWHAYRDLVEGRLILAGYPDPDSMSCRLFLPAVYAVIVDGMDAKQIRAFEEWLHEPWLTDRKTWGDRVDSPVPEEQRAMMEAARARPREPRP